MKYFILLVFPKINYTLSMSQSLRILEFFRKVLRQSEQIVLYRSTNPILCNIILEVLAENQIPAYVSQESVGQHIYPVNIGKLAEAEIIVSQKDFPRAKECLDLFLAQLESSDIDQPEGDEVDFID